MNPALLALQFLGELLRQAMAVSDRLRAARAEGREFTMADLAEIMQQDDVARANLVVAISNAKKAAAGGT